MSQFDMDPLKVKGVAWGESQCKAHCKRMGGGNEWLVILIREDGRLYSVRICGCVAQQYLLAWALTRPIALHECGSSGPGKLNYTDGLPGGEEVCE